LARHEQFSHKTMRQFTQEDRACNLHSKPFGRIGKASVLFFSISALERMLIFTRIVARHAGA
jgi:hypothetical protein